MAIRQPSDSQRTLAPACQGFLIRLNAPGGMQSEGEGAVVPDAECPQLKKYPPRVTQRGCTTLSMPVVDQANSSEVLSAQRLA